MNAVTTFETPTDLEIVITRVVDAPVDLVWEVWTSPEHLPHWMLGPDGWTMPVCEIDLRPGGGWRYVWRKDDGEQMEMTGTFVEVTPPRRLVGTEKWGEEWPETVNTLLLTGTGDRTTITNTVRYPSKEARDAALASGMKDGMSRSFERFDDYLGTVRP